MLTIARILGWHADWRAMTTRPTRALTAQKAAEALSRGCSERNVTRWWRWLEARGFLFVLEPGTTPQFRSALHEDDGNLAREFLLTIPVDRIVTPPRSSPLGEDCCIPRTRENGDNTAATGGGFGRRGSVNHDLWSQQGPISTHEDSGGLAGAVRRSSLPARRVRPAALERLLEPFATAGYSPGDVLFGLDHTPAGEPYRHTHDVRYPWAWLRHRLGAWLGEDGTPLPSRRTQLEQGATAHRETRERARREHLAREAARAPSGAQAEWAAKARAGIAARLRCSSPNPSTLGEGCVTFRRTGA